MYNSFPQGNSAFENCFEKGVITVSRGARPCLDLRMAKICNLNSCNMSGRGFMQMGMGMGSGCHSAWKCVPDGERVAIRMQE